ncbi:putative polysaccharide biosynthesis protein [Cellulosilyticum sp. I15G10I2]|uniref:putative polysaccharide biosynthesis protein n=1 Tax=Cellulosilyticum sp. I15G10I2 TaxID=1892843 RepID=UPI00085CC49B|nr:polysaccharide biosynthesis protein [Cellulosilyticum sp. I15G10I2]
MESKTNGQSIVKGAMILGIGVFLSRVIGLLYRIPITNILGDEGNGLYGLAFQVYSVILTFTAIAMPNALSKLIAEREAMNAYKDAHRVYKVAMLYSVAFAAVLAIGMWFGADWIAEVLFPKKNVGMPIRALAPTVIVATIIAVMRGYFQGQNNMTPTAVSQIIEQIFNVVFSVLLAYLFLSHDLIVAVTGSTLGTGIGAIAGLITLMTVYMWMRPNLKKKLRYSNDYQYENSGTILKQILVMMIPVVVSTSVFSIMGLIDQSMITRNLPASIAYLKENSLLHVVPVPRIDTLSIDEIVTQLLGQFSVKYFALLNVPISLIIQLGGAAIPAIAASMAVHNYKDVRKKIKLIFKVGLLIGAPSTVALILFANPIIGLLFAEVTGDKLLASGAIGIIFITLAQLSAGVLQGMGKPNIPTFNAVIACIIKIIVNWIVLAVPTLHIYGVIHSTTLCYLIYAILNINYLKRYLSIQFNWHKLLIKPMISASIMGLLAYGIYNGLMIILPSSKLWTIVIIPVAMVIYLFTGIATRTITKKDLLYIPGGKKLIKFLNGE